MTLSNLYSSTPLIAIRDAIKTIIEDSSLFETLLTDSQKGEIVIPIKALSSVNNTRSYALSVHHRSEEENDDEQTDLNGIEMIRGTVYVDILRRMNRKDGSIWDQIDILKHSVLTTLRQAPNDLNINIAGFEYAGDKNLVPLDQTEESPVLTVIKEMKFYCYYYNIYTRAYNQDDT